MKIAQGLAEIQNGNEAFSAADACLPLKEPTFKDTCLGGAASMRKIASVRALLILMPIYG